MPPPPPFSNITVEIVFQKTNVMNVAKNHPTHLHGYSFYLVGLGNGKSNLDPKRYNLEDPLEVNTIGVPKNGWAVNFKLASELPSFEKAK
ncbi:hypothetical protein V2J09_008989 [Rumex salicifolius]